MYKVQFSRIIEKKKKKNEVRKGNEFKGVFRKCFLKEIFCLYLRNIPQS